MSTLFSPLSIKSMTMKNRCARSATWEGMCDTNGRPTEQLIDCYRKLAEGKVGLIISGYTFVRPDGRQLPRKMGLHTDEMIPAARKLTAAVHTAGGLLCAQLVHAGGQTDSKTIGRQPLAPSAVKAAQFGEIPAAMTSQDITEIAAAFASAAGRAKTAGFDAVQLHGAHGYLISQFLSPLTNQRTDSYGGSITNRARFLLEVLTKTRQAVGDDYPVLIKLNGSDFLSGGLAIDEAVAVAKMLDAAGIDAIEVSGGTPASGDNSPVRIKIDSPDKEAYHRTLAQKIKAAVRCPVLVVGGVRSFDVADQIVTKDGLDGISLARPLIREPNLIARWQAGDRSPARCISCNGCFKPGLKGEGILCVVEKKEQEQKGR